MSDSKSIKILVAHPGQQHSYRTASALKRNGLLAGYVTTVYDKESFNLMKLLKHFLSGESLLRASKRKNLDLSDSDVIQYGEWRGLVEIFLSRYDKKRKLYDWWHNNTSDYFGRKVANLAIKEGVDAVILYDTNASECFRILKKKSPSILRVMDITAANRLYMKQIYEKDMSLMPQFSDKLRVERKLLWKKKYCKRYQDEIALTQLFLTPSNFVKESLKYSCVQDEQIEICPYGTNFETVNRDYNIFPSDPLKAVYVGNVTEMKGIGYLLEAAMQIPPEKVEITLVGNYDNTTHLFDKYMERVNFLGRIPHEKVKAILCTSDIFVFPSLGEGLSLSVLEAMACGLPCIVTKNSGANDAIIEGVNGYVVDIQDVESIRNKVLWFANHRERIPEMGRAAARSAEKYKWSGGGYDTRLVKILTQRLEKTQSYTE